MICHFFKASFVLLVVLNLAGCRSSTSFSSSGEKPAIPLPDPEVVESITESFVPVERQRPIDLVWIIDNSQSMLRFGEQIQLNFDAFIESLELKSDLRVALVSNIPVTDPLDPQPGVRLEEIHILNGHQQFPIKVESTNLLAIAARRSNLLTFWRLQPVQFVRQSKPLPVRNL